MKYFLHDSSSFDDDKITELFMQFGYEGIGLFYIILEKMAKQEKPIKTSSLKSQLKVGKRLEKCWSFMESIGIISSKDGHTFNERILSYSEMYQIKKQKEKERILQWRENHADKKNVTRKKSVRTRSNSIVYDSIVYNGTTSNSNSSELLDANPAIEYPLMIKRFEDENADPNAVLLSIKDFIEKNKPAFLSPYMDAWNIVAERYKLSKVQAASTSREAKFKTRISEPMFDFIKILSAIGKSDFLKGRDGGWSVDWDYIFENDNNYLKILEGKFK